MKNKGFTLIELIIVIAIIAVIMLIGTVAYSKMQERMKVRADKATAAEIGKALVIRETDIGRQKPLEYYPVLTIYDELEEIENYIKKEIRPQSMKDGFFIATALQTKNSKKIIVGIGKAGDQITYKPYVDSKEAGWAWSEEVEISEFLEENKDKLLEEVVIPTIPGSNIGAGGNNSKDGYNLTVGINNIVSIETQKEVGESVSITSGGDYTRWQISGISKSGGNINFNMPENDVKIIGVTGE